MATHSANTSRAASASPSTGSESPSRASESVSANPLYRPPTTLAVVPAVFDTPQATAPPFDGLFIHPPFGNLPGGVVLPPEGMNYSVMHQHPTWFLDIRDYITLDSSPEAAIRYPRDLEPPRPRRQKDLLLRCTFCPRTYAGVNAKSMWTRHVREKHRVVLSKAWSDTATSSRRQSAAKTTGPVLPIDTATPDKLVSISTPTSGNKSPLTPTVAAKPISAPVPKGKPGPKPGSKAAKTASPAKAKKVGAPRKIVIPAQKPKPPPPPPPVTPWVRSLSPPPPAGILPPRMRPFSRKSLGGIGSTEPKTDNLSISEQPAAESDQVEVAPVAVVDASVDSSPNELTSAVTIIPSSEPVVFEGQSITPPPTEAVPTAEASIPSDPTTPSHSPRDELVTESLVESEAAKAFEDEDTIQTEEVADLLLMDVDTFVDEPDEDVDMELEDEEEGLHPPISLGGLVGPMFGVEEPSSDPFSLSSRPLVVMSPVFSPALSPAVPQSAEGSSREPSVEKSTDDMRPATPQNPEPPEEEETPPLGRFKVSSLAYLMDKNLSVSPPPSPVSPSNRSLTPPPTDMEDEPPTATLFAAMQDVFVLKMQKMDPDLKAKFLGHLQEQFGVQVAEAPPPPIASEDGTRWASLPESVVKQIMSEHARANEDEGDVAMAEDTFGRGFTELANEFKQDSAVQLKDELEDQLQALVGAFTEELAVPLQNALTLQLKDEIIVQVADQMMDALVVQGEEAQVEFEWRRRFLERQLWADEEIDVQEDVIQHPLHHLFLSKAMPADMDVRMPTSLLC
ncbi:hypothetical protein MSAN_01381300 [Mycena sanguinolenta]|uniref:Uncharacterized protein n=1 Tax=Mycena sanguinolenta TaxID=230812 RepID=A0A8H6Y9K5_9AGAR|nr:hypothetical protein MSAN_01381300 [Mycena sanguinolenta]